MEILKVEEFLILKKTSFTIKRINIIIGPQANGKSILVKLLYFFRESINDTFLMSIKNKDTQKEFTKKISVLFEKYFPKYTWKDEKINIEYIQDDIKIKIFKTNSQRTIKVEYSEYFTKRFTLLKNTYKKFLKRQKNDESFIFDDFWEFKEEYLSDNEKSLYPYTNESIFIPASRSFFANLQKNIFSFLAENIDIDPFMKEFGSKYELAKKIYSDTRFDENIFTKIKSHKKLNYIVEQILNGKYEYKDKQDWIKSKNSTINLANASSGQQESLPMLLILSIFPFLNQKSMTTYFIEEPETHLFPVSQKFIIELVGLLYNNLQNVVITTHSPYILTALNNLFLAYDIKKEKGSDVVNKIIDEELCLNFDDVSAYTINNGKLKSIIDTEERLIGVNIIDSVSEEFNTVFDELLSLQD